MRPSSWLARWGATCSADCAYFVWCWRPASSSSYCSKVSHFFGHFSLFLFDCLLSSKTVDARSVLVWTRSRFWDAEGAARCGLDQDLKSWLGQKFDAIQSNWVKIFVVSLILTEFDFGLLLHLIFTNSMRLISSKRCINLKMVLMLDFQNHRIIK